jgi:hypothetical protein
VVCVEKLGDLARTEVPFSRLFLAAHHFETHLVSSLSRMYSLDYHFLFVEQMYSESPMWMCAVQVASLRVLKAQYRHRTIYREVLATEPLR